MVVLVLTACPPGLRGHLTRWLLEIRPGVFVGNVSKRVREKLWSRTTELCQDGRAILVFSKRNEQHLGFEVHRHDWEVVDYDGLSLVRRPASLESSTPQRPGWSKAARHRRFNRPEKTP